MAWSKEDLEQMNKCKDQSLFTFCCMNPSSTFYTSLTNPSFNKIARHPLAHIILNSFMTTEEELMKTFPLVKVERVRLEL